MRPEYKETHMSILHFHKLFLATPEAWQELSQTRPSAGKLFLLLVLPVSLIPPLMLEYAGSHIGPVLFPAAPAQAWSMAAMVFLLAELITVPLMAWAIKSIMESKGLASDFRDTFMLAAIAPMPMWLSSLVLFSEQTTLIAIMLALGVAGWMVLVSRGVKSVLKVEEGLVAFDIAYTITALGLITWVVVIMRGLIPVLS